MKTSKGPGEADTLEQRTRDLERMLASANRANEKLRSKVNAQKQQIRELQARLRHLEGIATAYAEFKAEVRELMDEVRELTRANREKAKRYEALQAENERLKVKAKSRRPDETVLKRAA